MPVYTPALLNMRFNVDPQAAEAMWNNGSYFDNKRHISSDPFDEIRIKSFSGYVVRMLEVDDPVFGIYTVSPDDHIDIFDEEIVRFREISKIPVISYAAVSSEDGAKIFTISPDIPQIKKCSKKEYYTKIVTPLREYYLSDHREGYIIDDLNNEDQYSTIPVIVPQPFLHDPDPFLTQSVPYGFI